MMGCAQRAQDTILCVSRGAGVLCETALWCLAGAQGRGEKWLRAVVTRSG